MDLIKLDRDLAQAERGARRFFRTLRTDVARAADDAWFEPVRYVTTRTTFEKVSELSESDPWRAPLRAWVAQFVIGRVGARASLAVANVRQQRTLHVESPERGMFSAADLVRRVLVDRDDERRALWLENLCEVAPAVASARRGEREIVREIASRLDAPWDLGFPYDRAVLAQLSTEFITRTEDLASMLLGRHEDLASLVGQLVARDVPGVWPTLVSSRWLSDQFRTTPLLDGLSLDVGPLPSTLGAASFARALARFGAAYARAAQRPHRHAPFALAHEPWGAHPLRRGALFASLAGDPVFLHKQMGFSREVARRVGRALAVSLLAQCRLDAARTLVDLVEVSSREVHEVVEHTLKVRAPEALAAVFPGSSPVAPVRFAGALLATGDRDALRSRFDEDWFKNPRAIFSLRDADAARPSIEQVFDGGVSRLVSLVEELAN